MFVWLSPPIKAKHCVKKKFMNGIEFDNTNARSKSTFFKHYKGKWLFITKSAISSKNIYAPHKVWSLFENLFESLVGNKKIKYEKTKYIYFFLSKLSFHISSH
jgi:hypothetical protein